MKKLLLAVSVILFLCTGCIKDSTIYPGDIFEASDVTIQFGPDYESITAENGNKLRTQVIVSEEDISLGGWRVKFDEKIGPYGKVNREVEDLEPGDRILIKIIIEGFEDDPIIETMTLG